MVNLGPWAVSDMWRGNSECGELRWAAEEAWLSVDGWKDEILGTTYEGGPCLGVEIVDAYRSGDLLLKSHNRLELNPDPDDLSQIGGVSTGAKVNQSNLINQLHSYLHGLRKADPDAAYQDDMRRG